MLILFSISTLPIQNNPSMHPVIHSTDIIKVCIKYKVLHSFQVLPLIVNLSDLSLTTQYWSPRLIFATCFSLDLDLNMSSYDLITLWQLLCPSLFDNFVFPSLSWLWALSIRASARKVYALAPNSLKYKSNKCSSSISL